MGRRGSWFSAIKKVFVSTSKDKLQTETVKKSSKEKKGRGRLKHGESRSFIPLFREPSSIEKILGEVDQQLLFMDHHTPVEQPATPQLFLSGKPASPRVTSPRTVSPPRLVGRRPDINYRTEPTLRQHHRSATLIQAAYRGYMARRSFRALRGLVRLQGVVRGQNVKRQTVNAMKQMQLLVRVQTQIQSRRIQMLETEALERHKNKEAENSPGKWTFNNQLDMGDDEHWDDSLITKEEREARLGRKMEAVIKRERAMAYAYSHQLWKGTPKSAQTEIRSGGFPWWWNWLERQLPYDEPTKNPESTPTPPRATYGPKTSPHLQSSTDPRTDFSFGTPTPKSSKSTFTRLMTPTRTSPSTTPNLMNNSKSKASLRGSPYPLKDDDSLMSCPPFSVPNYMSPTVSAKAKVRPTSNPKDRLPSSAASETSKHRFSFPLSKNLGSSFKWNNKSASKDSTPLQAQTVMKKHKSPRSIGESSMDSAISMPAAFGRKPFNRFV